MERRARSKVLWSAILVLAALGIAAVLYAARSRGIYTGVVKVMERTTDADSDRAGAQEDADRRLAALVQIATSNTVVTRSVETLEQAPVAVEPARLIRTLEVQPVSGTSILEIRVSSEDPNAAKWAADVVAAEFLRFYRELATAPTYGNAKPASTDTPAVQVIEPAYVYQERCWGGLLPRRSGPMLLLGTILIALAVGLVVGWCFGVSRSRGSRRAA